MFRFATGQWSAPNVWILPILCTRANNRLLADIFRVPDLLAQIRINPQIAQPGFFLCLPQDSSFQAFLFQNRPGWHMDASFGEIGMAEDQEPVPVGDVGKDFVDHWRHEAL
jgi:hypothetical protein